MTYDQLITEIENLADKWPHEGYVSPPASLPDGICTTWKTCHRCQLTALIERAKREQGDVVGNIRNSLLASCDDEGYIHRSEMARVIDAALAALKENP